MATYVVKSWYADQKVNSQGHYISLKGRAPGLISWAMSLLGISPTVSFECNCNNIVYETGSWSGKTVKAIPISKVSSVYYGYAKPWKAAVMLVVAGFVLGHLVSSATGSTSAAVMTTVLLMVLALAYYLLNKNLGIGVAEVGGIVSGIDFKRSIIENVNVDEAAAQRVYLIIQALVDRAHPKS